MAALLGVMLMASVASSQDVVDAAEAAGVDPVDLAGAVNTTGLEPLNYLYSVGELEPPKPAPVKPAYNARVACIEAKESGGENIWNRRDSGAGGVMQYMEGTFRAHAAEMGHPEWSRWNPDQARAVAAHDLAMERRSQWTVSGC